jgi:hypothetical protein
MRYPILGGAVFAAVLGIAASAGAQVSFQPPPQPLYVAPFQIEPALPDSMPTWSRDEMSGTAQHNIAATPGCGAANPQGGIPSMWSGNCP